MLVRDEAKSGLLWLRRHCAREDVQRRAAFLFLVGLRQRLARHHLVALRRVVDEDRFDGGNLLEVRRLQALDNILVRMMRA